MMDHNPHYSDKNSFTDIEMTSNGRGPTSDCDEDHFNLAHAETFQTTYEQALEGKLYHDGELIKQPAATRDPKDPMNLSTRRKFIAVFCLSFFGGLAASAEIILGAMLPVFVLQYKNIGTNPGDTPGKWLANFVDSAGGFTEGQDPLVYLDLLGKGPGVFRVYLLGAMPLLVIGLSNFILVPLAISLGRRPIVIVSCIIAIAGACWAGGSTSLNSHIAARCIQAVGAGTVESLIPFIIQDLVHVHERNTWISAAFAAQGVIIIAIGFSTPYIVVELGWQWVYYITAIAASAFLIGVIFSLPETRWNRTRSEMNGVPRDDANVHYSPRTYAQDMRLMVGKAEWKKGWRALVATIMTFFYPQVFFITILNGCMISAGFSASYLAAPALLTKPWAWPFQHLGFCLVAVLVAAILVALITGSFADYTANMVARRRGKRIPENQLINLILPIIAGFIGALLFGLAGQYQSKYPWPVFVFSFGCLAFGFLGTSSTGTVYVLECYPHLAGPALVSIASFRFIVAFMLTVDASNWVLHMGFLRTFSIYTGLIGGFGLMVPAVYYYGPAWRRRWPGTKWSS